MSFINAKIIGKEVKPEDYFKETEQRGTKDFVLSSSALRSFGHCPSRWKAGYVAPDSDAKDFGSLLDCIALTPLQLKDRYSVAPATYEAVKMECPSCKSLTDSKKCKACGEDRVEVKLTEKWNWNATACKEWLAKQGQREIVGSKEFEQAVSANERLKLDGILSSFIDASDKQVWLWGQWQDEKTGLTVPVKAMIDLVPRLETEFASCLGDLKTTRTAAVMAWQRDCFKMGYFIQAALYTDLYVAATGEDRNTWCFVLVENYPPFEIGRRMIGQETATEPGLMALGRQEYTRLLENYCACLKSGRWPGYDDTDEAVQGWSLVRETPYDAEKLQFLPRYDFDEPETGSDPEPVNDEIVP